MWTMDAEIQQRRETMTSQQGTAALEEQATGTKDTTYALVSVLYHALQGAETSVTYLQDAAEAGDQELMQFLREAQAWQRYLASQAQVLLTQRLHQSDGRVWNPETKIWNLTLMA
jgi:CHASE2 domain-containing sensor protein